MTEKAFEELMGTYKTAAMKTYIASIIGEEATRAMGLKYMDAAEVEAMYKQKYAESLEATNNGNYFPTSTNTEIQGNENGNLPQRNNNPGNIKEGGLDAVQKLATGKDSQGHLVFPDAESGFRALALDLEAKLTGNSRYLPANPTIAQLGKVYAEDPAWGRSVASILGVPVSTPTTLVPFEKLIYAISKQEGFFA